MNPEIKIKLTWGLVVFALIHAVAFAASAVLIHSTPQRPQAEPAWQVPVSAPPRVGETVRTYAPLQRPADVNLDAQSEMKQAGGCPTGTCDIQRPYRPSGIYNYQPGRPSYINGERVVRWGPSQPMPTQPRPLIIPATKPPAAKAPATRARPEPTHLLDMMPPPGPRLTIPAPGSRLNVTNVSNANDRPAGKEWQLILFLDDSPKSQQIIGWFKTDPTLVKARLGSDFQYYTPDNALYKTRYSKIVPVEQFPVILLLDETGGHIHAAGGNMIPGTPEELWQDFIASHQLYVEAKQGGMQLTGAMKTRGYSWDEAINPRMGLSAADCPDGNCPIPDSEPSWKPFDRVRPNPGGGGLFDKVTTPKNMFLWAGGTELLQLGILALGAMLIFYILIKRGK